MNDAIDNNNKAFHQPLCQAIYEMVSSPFEWTLSKNIASIFNIIALKWWRQEMSHVDHDHRVTRLGS